MELKNNQYTIQGIAIEKLIKDFGSPLYVYDANAISDKLSEFKKGFKNVDLKIKYACKALTNMSILKYMRKLGAGLDTVSLSEIKMGLQAGFQAQDIVFTPNCVHFSEIEEAVESGVKINRIAHLTITNIISYNDY